MNRLEREGARAVGVHYDIMCHYIKNLWARFGKLPPPVGPLYLQDLDTFVAPVPKFHLAGHVDSCYARFSLNNMAGVDRLDAEGSEHCWANLNHASGSTSERGPGSRVDGLNHVMQQWNWCKLVGMGARESSLVCKMTDLVFSRISEQEIEGSSHDGRRTRAIMARP